MTQNWSSVVSSARTKVLNDDDVMRNAVALIIPKESDRRNGQKQKTSEERLDDTYGRGGCEAGA